MTVTYNYGTNYNLMSVLGEGAYLQWGVTQY